MTPSEDKLPPLERYFRILEALSGFPDGLSLSELTIMLALPKASTHRLLAAMQKSSLVTLSGGATYVLTDRVRRLVHLSAGSVFVGQMTASHLQQLSSETGETCYIARLEGNRIRTIVMESPDAPWRGFVLPGKIMYPHAAACAKAILAFQSDALIEQALSGDLPHLTKHTKTDLKDIKTELRRVRKQGFATCMGEVDEGLAAAAVPIAVDLAGVIYAIGIVGPRPRITSLVNGDIVSRLTTVSKAIAACLSKTGSEITSTN